MSGTLAPVRGVAGVKNYTVTVDGAGRSPLTEEQAEMLVELLAPYGAAVSSSPVGRLWGVTLSLRTECAFDAGREALSALYAVLERAEYPVRRMVNVSVKIEEG